MHAVTVSTCGWLRPVSTTVQARGRGERGKGRVCGVSANLELQLQLAESSDRLDLSEAELRKIPDEIFELENLTELSLSGNVLETVPEQISKLTRLQKLQLAGNALRELPQGVGALTGLQGLWVHGNLLESLPETCGNLRELQKCSLSGNRLMSLPSTLSQMTALRELEVAGNRLRQLPSLEGLQELRKLTLHGNQLDELTESILYCLHLHTLALQGNALREVSSPYCFFPQGLISLNMADNHLQQLSCDVSNLTSLEHVTLYGNQLKTLPEGLMELPKLKSIWLEGNPLDAPTVEMLMQKRPIKIGLDQTHRAAICRAVPEESMVSFDRVPSPYQKGYFKLVRDRPDQHSEMLVIAFGSAPGTPNWGSVLRKVKNSSRPSKPKKTSPFERSKILDALHEEQEKKPELKFDVLFVVDTERSWYGAGTDDFERYTGVLRNMCAPYSHRIMIGVTLPVHVGTWDLSESV